MYPLTVWKLLVPIFRNVIGLDFHGDLLFEPVVLRSDCEGEHDFHPVEILLESYLLGDHLERLLLSVYFRFLDVVVEEFHAVF